MELIAFLIPFVLLGGVVVFIAFTGSPGAAREIYLTRGTLAFRVVIPVLYLALGVGVPALILANRGEAAGGTGALSDQTLTADEEQGKGLFRQQCSSCHNLDAVNARGVTGPDLDEIGEVTSDRVVNAIKNGGTGQDRMPAGLLESTEAEAVGAYVAKVAAR
jgi:mono/diheme cytochrome c family protein